LRELLAHDYLAALVQAYQVKARLAYPGLRSGLAHLLAQWGSVLGDAAKWSEAEDKYGQAEGFDPKSVEVYNLWGNTLFQRKDFEAAVKRYEQALRLQPDDKVLQENLKRAQDGALNAKNQ
jgi:tetratricopeptide (TPR) repeat protein